MFSDRIPIRAPPDALISQYRELVIRLFAAALVVILLSGCGLTETRTIVVTATPTHPTPAPVLTPAVSALSIDDVPRGFMQTVSRFHPNREVARDYGLTVADLQTRGRVTSFETAFRRQQAAGLLSIDDVVAGWLTTSGAHWDYLRVLDQITHPTTRQIGRRNLSASTLGDERTAFAFRNANQPANITDYAIVFRRGRYRAFLQLTGLAGTVNDGQVLSLARRIDKRLQRSR